MYPTMADGDYTVISRLFWRLSVGDIIVVKHPKYQNIIKRIDSIRENGDLWLKGDNNASLSPEKMGWISKQWVIGKVIYTIQPSNTARHYKKS